MDFVFSAIAVRVSVFVLVHDVVVLNSGGQKNLPPFVVRAKLIRRSLAPAHMRTVRLLVFDANREAGKK